MKKLIITEKPSVGRQFASVLGVKSLKNGYFENDEWIVTWCLGHLVALSYPDKYDPALKRWSLDSLPFLPSSYLYEVITGDGGTSTQFNVVKRLLNRRDVTEVYNAGDSGREGEYIQRLVYDMAGCTKPVKRVWINSQTKEEILRGIREAKPSSDYDCLAAAAYERAIADYMVGINFTRAMTEKAKSYKSDNRTRMLSVGRVMTCVLAMVAERERERDDFKPVDFFRIEARAGGMTCKWKATKGSTFYRPEDLYKDSGLLKEADADGLMRTFKASPSLKVMGIQTREEPKKAPYLYNLAELQGDCAKKLKISPEMTLNIVQSLYEHKLTTYPRTDARVLSSAVMKEIDGNLRGLSEKYPQLTGMIHDQGWVRRAAAYVDDKKISDHYAIIPTGVPVSGGLSRLEEAVYDMIARRFLSIFFPPAVYSRTEVELVHEGSGEKFVVSDKYLVDQGYLQAAASGGEAQAPSIDVRSLSRGTILPASFEKAKSQTKPPARYTSGSMILAMENAGKLIEDEDLRAQIKGSGIGTSATRANTISKLCRYGYLDLEEKTQTLTPTQEGYLVHDLVKKVIGDLESPAVTAGWEKQLSMIEKGEMDASQFRRSMEDYVRDGVGKIKAMDDNEVRKIQSRYLDEKYLSKPKNSGFDAKDICPCRCGGTIRKITKPDSEFYVCSSHDKKKPGSCGFIMGAAVYGRKMDEDLIRELMEKGCTDYLDGFSMPDRYRLILQEGQSVILQAEKSLLCPRCGKPLSRQGFKIKCQNCGFETWGKTFGREISDEEFRILFRDSAAGPYDGFISMKKATKGRPFSGYLLFDGAKVYVGEEVICGRQMLRSEYITLAEQGRTEELEGFKSRKGKDFSARLILKDGFVAFDM